MSRLWAKWYRHRMACTLLMSRGQSGTDWLSQRLSTTVVVSGSVAGGTEHVAVDRFRQDVTCSVSRQKCWDASSLRHAGLTCNGVQPEEADEDQARHVCVISSLMCRALLLLRVGATGIAGVRQRELVVHARICQCSGGVGLAAWRMPNGWQRQPRVRILQALRVPCRPSW